jgi:hypothetical protein
MDCEKAQDEPVDGRVQLAGGEAKSERKAGKESIVLTDPYPVH